MLWCIQGRRAKAISSTCHRTGAQTTLSTQADLLHERDEIIEEILFDDLSLIIPAVSITARK